MNSNLITNFPRWIAGYFLIAVLLVWGMSPVYAGDVSSSVKGAQAQERAICCPPPVKIIKITDGERVREIEERVKELEAKERQNYALELDGQRKQVDWWLSFLGVILAGLAIFVTVAGIAIPYVMARKDKEIIDLDKKAIDQDKRAIEQDKAQISALLNEVKGMKDDAVDSVEEIHRHEAEAKVVKETVLSFQSGTLPASEKAVKEAVGKIEKDKTADPLLRLRAEAIGASQAGDTAKSYALWNALTMLEPNDASAAFNAGYWASQSGEEHEGTEKLYWLKIAGKHYEKTLSLKPDIYDAAYNWGNDLATEAKATASQDLASARALWNRAGEKFQQALNVKADKHEAANNWGNSLATEAQAVSSHDLAGARVLWKQAKEKYQQALNIKADKYETALNWGIALAAEAEAVSAQDLPAARALWKQAGGQFRLALQIKPDKPEAANNWGSALAAEAEAVSSQDLVTARSLWKQAGEKFHQALEIDTDKHEAASNWGNALAAEAVAVSSKDLAAARGLWKQAGEKYQQMLNSKPDEHDTANNWGAALAAEARVMARSDVNESNRVLKKAEQLLLAHADAVPGLVAYNLACVFGLRGDVQSCLKWLKVSLEHKTLPSQSHICEDKDLDLVRRHPDFEEWFKRVYP